MSRAARRPARLRVGIRGRGRAGTALARALVPAGADVAWIPGRSTRPGAFDLLVLAVPDDMIEAESKRLVRAGVRARCAIHLSGALPSEALRAWSRTGAATVSFHPLRSFAGRPGETVAGADVAIEGDPRGIAAARGLARRIGARPWRIGARDKPLYHAAATAAAGGSATLVALAAEAARAAGMPPGRALAAMAALSEEAVENVVSRGFAEGLTGPLARGDAGTLRLHRRALRRVPALAGAYRALAEAARGRRGK
jgi:predicted short-subunit dehydrogenase-like oxidoreductase (DUF2520 family)